MSKVVNRLLRRLGYIKVDIAKRKVKSYKVKYEDALDQVTLLEMEMSRQQEEYSILASSNAALHKKLMLAEAIMRECKVDGGRK